MTTLGHTDNKITVNIQEFMTLLKNTTLNIAPNEKDAMMSRPSGKQDHCRGMISRRTTSKSR